MHSEDPTPPLLGQSSGVIGVNTPVGTAAGEHQVRGTFPRHLPTNLHRDPLAVLNDCNCPCARAVRVLDLSAHPVERPVGAGSEPFPQEWFDNVIAE